MHENDEKKFKTDMGINAKVLRSSYEGEHEVQANNKLVEVGELLQPNKVTEYMGSMAVHIYKSPTLGHIVYMRQILVGKLAEIETSQALKDLKNAAMTAYGRSTPTDRSGL